jgi:hypothetical protein
VAQYDYGNDDEAEEPEEDPDEEAEEQQDDEAEDQETESNEGDEQSEESESEEQENESEREEEEIEEQELDDMENNPEEGIDGTDDSTELAIEESVAEETARNALSDNNWALERSSTHEEDGFYRFRFVIEGQDAEAEVRVDGSSGEPFRLEEEIESESSEVNDVEKVQVENMEEARDRISELREQVMELRRQLAEAQGQNTETEREVEIQRRNGETEVEAELEANGTETEVDAEVERRENETEAEEVEREGPPAEVNASADAQGSVNGTPGSDQAQENRPGFVSQLLGGIFG